MRANSLLMPIELDKLQHQDDIININDLDPFNNGIPISNEINENVFNDLYNISTFDNFDVVDNCININDVQMFDNNDDPFNLSSHLNKNNTEIERLLSNSFGGEHKIQQDEQMEFDDEQNNLMEHNHMDIVENPTLQSIPSVSTFQSLTDSTSTQSQCQSLDTTHLRKPKLSDVDSGLNSKTTDKNFATDLTGRKCSTCSVDLIKNCSSPGKVTCEYCGDAINIDTQHLHPCISSGNAPAHCHLCGNSSTSTSFSSEATAEQSSTTSTIINKRRGRKPRCEKCNMTFITISEKQNHINVKHVNDYKCCKCGAMLKSAENLRRHMLCHSINAKHSCTLCKARFKHLRSLRLHLLTCGKNVLAQSEMIKKKNKNCIKGLFMCAICGKRFSVKPSVSRHIRIVHHGERPHQCLDCGKCFTSKYNLGVHRMKAHVVNEGDDDEITKCEPVNIEIDSSVEKFVRI